MTRRTRFLHSLLVPALLAVTLAAGCSTTGAGMTDLGGKTIPRGHLLDGERYDAPELLAQARRVTVLPFPVDPALSSDFSGLVLESAATIASEELAETLRRSPRIESVQFGTIDANTDLVVQGRLVGYVRPTRSSDVLTGGKQRVDFTGELYDNHSRQQIGAFHVREPHPGRKWWDDEEKELKKLARLAGQRIAIALSKQIH